MKKYFVFYLKSNKGYPVKEGDIIPKIAISVLRNAGVEFMCFLI